MHSQVYTYAQLQELKQTAVTNAVHLAVPIAFLFGIAVGAITVILTNSTKLKAQIAEHHMMTVELKKSTILADKLANKYKLKILKLPSCQ